MTMTIPEWQGKVDAWASKTFDHTEIGIAKHLLREAVELCRALGMSDKAIDNEFDIALCKDPSEVRIPDEEAADVLILDLALAGYLGFDLETAVAAKHAVNIVRKWGKPDQSGVTEHIRD